MNFSDIFNKAFVEGFSNTDLGLMEIVMVFGMAVLLGGYIFLVYRSVTKTTF